MITFLLSLYILNIDFFYQRFQAWAGSNSELTPSETVETSEEEVCIHTPYSYLCEDAQETRYR
jgi:hypothetical protein